MLLFWARFPPGLRARRGRVGEARDAVPVHVQPSAGAGTAGMQATNAPRPGPRLELSRAGEASCAAVGATLLASGVEPAISVIASTAVFRLSWSRWHRRRASSMKYSRILFGLLDRRPSFRRGQYPSDLARLVCTHWSNLIGGEYIPPPLPPPTQVRAVVDKCFLASLEQEEGRPLRFRVCCVPAGSSLKRQDGDATLRFWRFGKPRRISVPEFRKLDNLRWCHFVAENSQRTPVRTAFERLVPYLTT